MFLKTLSCCNVLLFVCVCIVAVFASLRVFFHRCIYCCVIVGIALAESPELSYLATAVPLVSLAMAATAPFALFRGRPSASLSFSHASAETRVGSTYTGAGGGVGVGAAGDWSGPMLPAEVRRFLFSTSCQPSMSNLRKTVVSRGTGLL